MAEIYLTFQPKRKKKKMSYKVWAIKNNIKNTMTGRVNILLQIGKEKWKKVII